MTKLGNGSLAARIGDVVRGVAPRRRGGAKRPRDVRVIGHRGAPRSAPENTIASFRSAIERGASAIEVDVCATCDGRYVLWHDPDPRETITVARDLGEGLAYVANEPAIGSPLRRPIEELPYADFVSHYGYTRRRDAVSHVLDGNTPPEVRPDTLEALLDYAGEEERLRDVYLDVKLRDPARVEQFVGAVNRAVETARFPTNFHLLCAEVEVLDALRRARLKVFGDFELPGVLRATRRLGLRCVSMGCGQRPWRGFLRETSEVVRARDRGELDSVVVWTVNDEQRLRALVDLGVDGIITDDCELLCRVLGEVDCRLRTE